jgi:hypothetical protein
LHEIGSMKAVGPSLISALADVPVAPERRAECTSTIDKSQADRCFGAILAV